LVPLVQAIATYPPIDDAMLRLDYDEQKQWDTSLYASQQLGYDLERGRMDRSAHPFCTSFSAGDVRITTRVARKYLPTCLMGTLHETGHALYEQGFPERYRRTPLGHSASLGIHESQSRLWENLVGRSRGFWRWFYPHLQSVFPENLGAVDGEAFYRALNVVRPSFIRIEADELTYNLHIMLRFELEVELLAGRLEAKDAPEAWNAQFEELFGLAVPSNRIGVLQDTHWAVGLFGYFPTYTLGNLGSAQLFEKAVADLPGIPAGFERGDFSALLGWLRQNVHAHGRKYRPADLMRVATGQPPTARPYLQYLWQKYQGIYGDLPQPPAADAPG
jgi:carboxypeptidase Taq